jgi:O-antigen/teichoic acid export membrane protein
LRNLAASARGLLSGDFVRHGLLVFASSMLVNVLGYAFHFAISRKIGVEQYGVLSALNAGLMLSSVVGSIGTTVVVKYAAEFRALDDRAHLAALVRRLSLFGTLAGVLVALAGIALSPAIASYLKVGNVTAVALTTIVIGFSVATPCLRGVFVGTEDFSRFSVSIVIESTLKAILGIGLVYAGFGVNGAFCGWAGGSFVSFLYTIVVLGRRYRQIPGATLFVDFRRLARTTANVALATLLIASISYADVLIVKHFVDPTEAGLYGALSLSGKILLFLVGFVPTVVLPKATRQAMRGESPVGVFLQALAISVTFSCAGLVVYYLYPELVVTALAGAAFAPAAPYVFGYGLAMVLLAGLNLVVVYKIGIHRFDFIVPLAICAIGELAGISLHHRSLFDVVSVLLVGNGLALVACAYRVTAPLASRARISAASDAA